MECVARLWVRGAFLFLDFARFFLIFFSFFSVGKFCEVEGEKGGNQENQDREKREKGGGGGDLEREMRHGTKIRIETSRDDLCFSICT